MKNIIGVYNPYGLVQKAGKKTNKRRSKNIRKRSKRTRKYRK
jgi:hypothetical protein